MERRKKNYDFGEINWDEFWAVVKGNGPCNKQRLEARQKGARRRRLGGKPLPLTPIKTTGKTKRPDHENRTTWIISLLLIASCSNKDKGSKRQQLDFVAGRQHQYGKLGDTLVIYRSILGFAPAKEPCGSASATAWK